MISLLGAGTKPEAGTAIDASNPLSTNLRNVWAFLEGSGNASVDSVGSANLTLDAGTSWAVEGGNPLFTMPTGINRPAILAEDVVLDGTVPWTIVFGAYQEAHNDQGTLFGIHNNSDSYFWLPGGRQLARYRTTPGANHQWTEAQNPGLLPFTTLKNYALVFDGVQIGLYQEGVRLLINNNPGQNSSGALTIMTIGNGFSGSGLALIGKISYVYVYEDRLLTDQEVSDLHEDPFRFFESPAPTYPEAQSFNELFNIGPLHEDGVQPLRSWLALHYSSSWLSNGAIDQATGEAWTWQNEQGGVESDLIDNIVLRDDHEVGWKQLALRVPPGRWLLPPEAFTLPDSGFTIGVVSKFQGGTVGSLGFYAGERQLQVNLTQASTLFYQVNLRRTTTPLGAFVDTWPDQVYDSDRDRQTVWIEGQERDRETAEETGVGPNAIAVGALANAGGGPFGSSRAADETYHAFTYWEKLLTDAEKAEFEGGPELFYSSFQPNPAQIFGDMRVGLQLEAHPGTWSTPAQFQSNGPSVYFRQWTIADDESGTNVADIPGATDRYYRATEEQIGKWLSFRVIAENSGGRDPAQPWIEAPFRQVRPFEVPDPVNVVPPEITGSGAVGDPLTVTPGIWASEPVDVTIGTDLTNYGSREPDHPEPFGVLHTDIIQEKNIYTIEGSIADDRATVQFFGSQQLIEKESLRFTTADGSVDTVLDWEIFTGVLGYYRTTNPDLVTYFVVNNGNRLDHFLTYSDLVASYQWRRGSAPDGSDAEDIPGATGETYVPEEGDLGLYIHCVETVVGEYGETGSALSNLIRVGDVDSLSIPFNWYFGQ